MYKVISGGETVGYSDTIVFIRLHENGCYVPCDESEAEGFCAKTVFDWLNEETGETETRIDDFVYKFSEGGLHGSEPEGKIEQVSGALKIAEADKVVDILLGGAE
jgi:hypothetical protein